MILSSLIQKTIQQNASDIHLGVGYKPYLRVDGALKVCSEFKILTEKDLEQIKNILLTQGQAEKLERERDIDLAYSHQNQARFRVNGYFERQGLNFALRCLSKKIPTMQELNLPPVIQKIAEEPYGLILVTGPTGSGKSTTIASIIDYINQTRAEHIITIEDPIEYQHQNKKSLIKQREVGENENTLSFPQALRAALREDPDVILVGEMRDLETTSLTITAAETGHLVLSTLHTNNTYQAINRIIDIFPPYQQSQIRIQIATSLTAIIAQRLIPKIDGGRLAAFEIMIANSAIKNLIASNKISSIPNTIKTAREAGMILLEDHLKQLIEKKLITQNSAKRFLTNQIT